jgi:hypothetical protein
VSSESRQVSVLSSKTHLSRIEESDRRSDSRKWNKEMESRRLFGRERNNGNADHKKKNEERSKVKSSEVVSTIRTANESSVC